MWDFIRLNLIFNLAIMTNFTRHEKLRFLTLVLSVVNLVFSCSKPELLDRYAKLINKPADSIYPNHSPVAIAETNDSLVILPQNRAFLVGYNSYDPDVGDVISYNWTQFEGPQITMENSFDSVCFLNNLVPGTYRFILRVTDKRGLTAEDDITLHVFDGTDTTDFVLFDGLRWINDTIEKMVYMETPPLEQPLTAERIVAVFIYAYNFDYPVHLEWKRIEKDGDKVGYIYYKIRDNKIIVYTNYLVFERFPYGVVAPKIKVFFQ